MEKKKRNTRERSKKLGLFVKKGTDKTDPDGTSISKLDRPEKYKPRTPGLETVTDNPREGNEPSDKEEAVREIQTQTEARSRAYVEDLGANTDEKLT